MRDKNEELKDQLAKNDNQIVAPAALQDFLMVFKVRLMKMTTFIIVAWS